MQRFYIGILLIIVNLIACWAPSHAQPVSYLVKTQSNMPITIGGYVNYFYYDSLGRLKREVSVSEYRSEDSTITLYTYYKDSITEIRSHHERSDTSNVVVSDTNVHYLNAKGYATGKSYFRGRIAYNFDDNGFLVSIDFPDYAGYYEWSISNGDIISKKENGTNERNEKRLVGITTSTYYPTIDTRDFGKSFLGSRSTHLVKTSSSNYSNQISTYDYSYTFDKFGRVVTMTIIQSGFWRSKDNISYTYY